MGPAVDTELLDGFQFACRPGCALCCFTTPAVSPEERPRLLAIAPSVPLVEGEGGFTYVRSRPEGGACHLLSGLRCSAHPARPFPCRTYPITVYLGRRAQASLVLSCPGVDLKRLARAPLRPAPSALGLDDELAVARAELGRPATRRREDRARGEVERAIRRLEREGRWGELEPIRHHSVGEALRHGSAEFPAPPPPTREQGVENLPLLFDATHGRIALAGSAEGWSVLRLREEGGPGPLLGTYPAPERRPSLDAPAQALLHGYVEYAARRDQLVGQLLLPLAEDPGLSLAEAMEEELCAVAADVLTRAAVLAHLNGRGGERLDEELVAYGIRATDAELLDRPLVGEIL